MWKKNNSGRFNQHWLVDLAVVLLPTFIINAVTG
jgi:hypothetical protein